MDISASQKSRDPERQPSLLKAALGAAIGAIVGAILHAFVIRYYALESGAFMIATGTLSGIGARLLGDGRKSSFGLVGMAFALTGCALGAAGGFLAAIAANVDRGILEIAFKAEYLINAYDLAKSTLGVFDLAFLAISAYAAFAIARIAPPELPEDAIQEEPPRDPTDETVSAPIATLRKGKGRESPAEDAESDGLEGGTAAE